MTIREAAAGAFDGALGVTFFVAWVALVIGELYWIWMAIQIGSFWMFVAALIPPFFLVAAPVGAWSFVFGPPSWVFTFFA